MCPHPKTLNPKPRPPLADSALELQCILDTVGEVRAGSPASHGALDMLLGLLREGSSMSSVAAAESSLKNMLGERLVHCCTESAMNKVLGERLQRKFWRGLACHARSLARHLSQHLQLTPVLGHVRQVEPLHALRAQLLGACLAAVQEVAARHGNLCRSVLWARS